MSAYRNAVEDWNRRYREAGRTAAPDLDCPRCHQPRLVTVTTVLGQTTAYCGCCAFAWVVVP